MRKVAIVSAASRQEEKMLDNEVEMMVPLISEVRKETDCNYPSKRMLNTGLHLEKDIFHQIHHTKYMHISFWTYKNTYI